MTEPNFDHVSIEDLRAEFKRSESRAEGFRATADELREIADDADREAEDAENRAHSHDEYTGALEDALAKREATTRFAGFPQALAEVLAVMGVQGYPPKRFDLGGSVMVSARYFVIRAPEGADITHLDAVADPDPVARWIDAARALDGKPSPCTMQGKPARLFHGVCYDPVYLDLVKGDRLTYGQTTVRHSPALVIWSDGRPAMVLMAIRGTPDKETSND